MYLNPMDLKDFLWGISYLDVKYFLLGISLNHPWQRLCKLDCGQLNPPMHRLWNFAGTSIFSGKKQCTI